MKEKVGRHGLSVSDETDLRQERSERSLKILLSSAENTSSDKISCKHESKSEQNLYKRQLRNGNPSSSSTNQEKLNLIARYIEKKMKLTDKKKY